MTGSTSPDGKSTKIWQVVIIILSLFIGGILIGGLIMFAILPDEQRMAALYTIGLIPATATLTPTPTSTSTPSATATPTSTFTLTPTSTLTLTPTTTPSFTPTPTSTSTPTLTVTPSITPTPTAVAFQNNILGVIVANFDGNQEIEDAVIRQLDARNIAYSRIYEDVNTNEEARTLGENYNAALVVWGVLQDDITVVLIEVTRTDIQQVERTIIEENSFGAVVMNVGSLGIDITTDDDMTLVTDYIAGALNYLSTDYDTALSDFQRVQSVLVATNRTEEAAAMYTLTGIIHLVLGEEDLATIDLQQARRLDPSQGNTYYLLGYVFSNQGALAEAIEMYTIALSYEPENVSFLNSRGIAYGQSENYEAALADFNEAIRIDPDFGRSFYNRAVAYINSNDAVNAIPDLNRAIEFEIEVATSYFYRGAAYAQIGEYPLAIQDFNASLEIDPSNTLAYYYRGVSYVQSENLGRQSYSLAIRDLTTAIEREPENTRFLVYRANLYSQMMEYDSALEDYGRVLELEPENINALANRTNLYLQIRDYDRVISDANALIQTNPDFYYAYVLIGSAYFFLPSDGNSNNALAIENFTRSIELNPEDIESYAYRALLYYELEEYDLARADIERATALNGGQIPDLVENVARDLRNLQE